MTKRKRACRAVVLGGPGGYLTVMSLWQWQRIRAGQTRIETVRNGRRTVLYLNDHMRGWVPLFTFRPERASVDAAQLAALRRFELV